MTDVLDRNLVRTNLERLLLKQKPAPMRRELEAARDSLRPMSRYATIATNRANGEKQVRAHATLAEANRFLSDQYDEVEADLIVDLVSGDTFTVYVTLHVGEQTASLL
jgi:hypothetical protein